MTAQHETSHEQCNAAAVQTYAYHLLCMLCELDLVATVGILLVMISKYTLTKFLRGTHRILPRFQDSHHSNP